MSMIVRGFEQLPPRIQDVLRVRGVGPGEFVLGLKSSYKPNATIPILWFIVTAEHLLLCNTHKTRGLWKEMSGQELTAFELRRSSLGKPYFVLPDSEGTVYLTLPDETPPEDLDALTREFARLHQR
ncbi:hypothetical protein HPC49_03310 [Pyxidicoccus fallax]|uniref:YokE-like PH domain-containing protein n=1 Tax=Pyxidicoccus fallax TaxID=394095 RepID=A0A848LAU5_9BACT|nr:hypothetical protein [Pyxidicoccus fallax]NMO15747.1 hypothetical protein [Pyxidicoccus fallax]NPC77285.1 hypothetical protein [Pyxidicoccus fallax]